MKSNDIQSFRRLIQYAKQEADELKRPFVSYLLGMVLCELDSTDENKTANGTLTSTEPRVGNGSLISKIDVD